MLDVWSQQLIEGRVASGRLAPDPENVIYEGLSNGGNVCAACDQPIHAGEMEVESVVPGGSARRYFHSACREFMEGTSRDS
jgi:hypothetical protein